jgi:hypothetical protein
MSWKPEVKTVNDDKWYGNALAFATQEEAVVSAKDLMNRWLLVTDCRAVESDEPVNYRIDLETFEMIPVEKPTEIMGVPV